jgi:DNA-binding transcriptional MocR family regulator
VRRDHGPIYAQIERDLRRSIADGQWGIGTRIPTEEALCTRYGVSRMTVRQALERLSSAGLLVRRRGVGTQLALGSLRSVGGENEDGDVVSVRAHLLVEGAAIHHGHGEIEQDGVERRGGDDQALERLGPVRGLRNADALVLEQAAQERAEHALVIHDEDMGASELPGPFTERLWCHHCAGPSGLGAMRL